MDAPNSPQESNSDVEPEEYWSNANTLLLSKKDVLLSVIQSDEYQELLTSVEQTLCRIEESFKTINVTPNFRTLISSLSDLLDNENVDPKVCSRIVKIAMKLSSKNILPLESINYVSIVCFLLRNYKNSAEITLVTCTRYLKKLVDQLANDHVKTMCLIEKHKLLPSLKIAFTNAQFLTSDPGMEIIAAFIALDYEFIQVFHDRISKQLMLCKKPLAINFGKIYFHIWNHLPEDERQVFEKDHIQWFMDRACTIGRSELVQKHLLSNVQGLLKGLHESRKLIKFTKVITELYTPVLWKYLSSSNSIHRCNAAEILMDAYPLEKPREGEKIYSKNLRKQHDEMLQLLDDPCPAIRCIAIKGICLNMQYFWITFQNGTAERVMKKFVSDLVLDGSSYEVRKSVYQGLTYLLKCEESHTLLKHVLPLLKDFIHDENQSVRQAFIFMLLQMKELNCTIKYYDIVNMANFAARLGNDTPKNRQLIVRLIFSSFFNEKLSLDESFSRVCKFIKVNPAASRYLATYSNPDLKFENAVRFMCMIFLKLRKAISKTIPRDEDENAEEKESDGSRRYEVSKHNSVVLGTIENVNDSGRHGNGRRSNATLHASNISDVSDLKNILEPRITHGLLDFIGVLWLIHRKTLREEESKERLEELYVHSEKCLPIILRYLRGTHAYHGALNVASMIPYSKIYHVTTIVGACKTDLCHLTLDSPANEYRSFIHALCKWNRGGDIIELAIERIDEAFRPQALNESAMISKTRAGKRVKFARKESNPMLALRILDELFSSPTDQSVIFSKNLDEVRELLKFMSKIKILIERRIERGVEINDSLGDPFLIDGLTLYGNLIVMFDQNKVAGYDYWEAFSDYLNWCKFLFAENCRNIGEVREQKIDSMIFDLLQVPLKQCVNIIALGKCDNQQLITILKFVSSLLDSDYGLYFVELSLHLVKQLILFSKAHPDEIRDREIMSSWFPEIVEKLLSAITDEVYAKETLTKFIKNLGEFKRNLIFVYLLCLKLYPEVTQPGPSYKIMHAFCQSLINLILFPITECETLNIDQDVKNLPFIGSLMATVFISQLELASALFYVLRVIIESFTERDGLKLLACCSLLYTLAFSKSKVPKPEVLKVVKITHSKIQQIPTEDGCLAVVMNYEPSINDRTIIDVEDTTERAIKEIGLHILVKVAEELGGSLPGNEGRRNSVTNV